MAELPSFMSLEVIPQMSDVLEDLRLSIIRDISCGLVSLRNNECSFGFFK